jgi:bifunctional non-homologous end joining protein LigD
MKRKTAGKNGETAKRASTEKASSPDRLATYRAKRDFAVTPEPGSSQDGAPGGNKSAKRHPTGSTDSMPEGAHPLEFVIQKHDARRLHYDVRLEVDGAMVSWAVPKGPSFDPAVKRLAVQTEDHPMAYNEFEGRIPDGEYGAGDVLIWDRGTYDTVPPGQQQAMLAKGHLHVRIEGEKLSGDWHFVRTSSRGGGARNADDGAGQPGKAQWLFFKAKDAQANPEFDVVAERPDSVVSGREATRGPQRVHASEQGQSARALKETVGDLALATSDVKITRGDDWLFEIKYDGYRLLACKAGPEVRLYTRRSNDWTDRFRPVADAVARITARECVIDGEACVVDEKGRPSFGALQEWLASASAGKVDASSIVFAVFDLLWLDGRDLRREPIERRRELLEALLKNTKPPIVVSRAVEGDLKELLATARASGLEGLVAKRRGSAYGAGRSGSWVKLRFDERQECAIAGYLPMSGTEDDVGALLLGVCEPSRPGVLAFAGRVGSGFDGRTRTQLAKRLDASRVAKPMVEGAPVLKEARWVKPELVCECAFTEWTREGSMRHPRFLGLREDKTPAECVREAPPTALASVTSARATPKAKTMAKTKTEDQAAPRGHAFKDVPKLSNPDKVLYPNDGYTKQDIWNYYTAIAPYMLPHLEGRPLTLQRYPNGILAPEWYQQNMLHKMPDFVRLVEVGERHDNKQRIVCDNLPTLQYLANLAALTLHGWSAHEPTLHLPDYVVLDLDPGDGPWEHLVEVARAVKALLDALSLESIPKTSGKRGVHVVVPIAPGPTHEEATGFAEQIARAVAKVLPKVATVERMKDKRGGKLYVDYGQNGEGKTVVCPYTIRARDGAVVSTPIEWDELDEKLVPTKFTIKTVLERVAKRGDLYARVLGGTQKLPKV